MYLSAVFKALCNNSVTLTAVVFSLVMYSGVTQAWSERVHGKIAIEAAQYSDHHTRAHTKSSTRSRLDAAGKLLAKNTPRLYKKWLKQSANRLSERDRAIAWLGVWPDKMKSQSLTALLKKNSQLKKQGQLDELPDFLKTQKTGTWHYDNLFFYNNGPAHSCSQRNKGQLFNVLSQLDQQLQKPVQSEVLNAMYISFYIHFYSDAHQPLHIVSRVNKDCWHDKGGNDVCLIKRKKSTRCKVNLHQYWDRAAYQNVDTLGAGLVESLPSFYTPDKPEFKAKLFNEATQVYPYMYPVIKPNASSFNQALTSSYQQQAKKITAQRISLTIVRLSHRLDALFYDNKKAP